MLTPGGWAQCTETSPPQWDTEYGPEDPEWAKFATMLRNYCDERKLPRDGSHIETIFHETGFQEVECVKTIIPLGVARERLPFANHVNLSGQRFACWNRRDRSFQRSCAWIHRVSQSRFINLVSSRLGREDQCGKAEVWRACRREHEALSSLSYRVCDHKNSADSRHRVIGRKPF